MFGSWELALAAYNCGEGCVSRAIAANQKRGLPTDYLSLKLPAETRSYVPKLIAVKNIVLAPATYGIELETLPDEPYFTAVPAPAKIDVGLAARLAGMSVEEFVALNPAHRKPVAVAPAGTLIVPLDKAEAFRANLESYDQPLVSWTVYNAKKGESTDAIGKRYGLGGAQLRAANEPLKLDRKGRLRASQQLLVPAAPKAAGVKVAQASIPTASETPTERAEKPATVHWYTVRAGDTLYGIARRANTALETLLHLNGLTTVSIVKPGLRLRLQ